MSRFFRKQPTDKNKLRDDAPFLDYLVEPLERRAMLTIFIQAAGETNQETMRLLVNNEVVRTWNNVGGDANARSFRTYRANVAADVTIDQIRIAFTNDSYDPNAPDRNLRVDRINLNGTVYQTESPNVFSTGTYKACLLYTSDAADE